MLSITIEAPCLRALIASKSIRMAVRLIKKANTQIASLNSETCVGLCLEHLIVRGSGNNDERFFATRHDHVE